MIRNEASFSEMGCTKVNFERFQLIEAKVVFLSIFNSSKKSIELNNISQNYIEDGGFIYLDEANERLEKKALNNLLLESGKCLLIPYCIMLTDFKNEYSPEKCLKYSHIDDGQAQDIRPISLQNNNTPTIGVRNIIRNIESEVDGFITDYPVKELDPNNILLISRFWECGSCPHLFGLKNKSNDWEYICEVFSSKPDKIQEFIFEVGQYDFEKLKIVELEKEITKLDYISLDNQKICKNLTLNKWEEYSFDVSDKKSLKIKGSYSLIKGVEYKNNVKMKKQKIQHYIIDN